jgi:hypothetical protein
MTMQYQETEEERVEEHNKYLDNLDKYCNNCGRIHTGRLVEEHLDGDNKPIEIVICNGPVFIKDTEYRDYEQARAQMIADNIPPDFESDNNENTENTNETPTTEDT